MNIAIDQKMNLAFLVAPSISAPEKRNRTSLERLPLELIYEILGYLDIYTLKQYRSVCQLLNATISSQIFKTLSLETTSKSAARFNALAKSKLVSPYVQQIYLEAMVDVRRWGLRSSTSLHKDHKDFVDAISNIVYLENLKEISLTLQNSPKPPSVHKTTRKRSMTTDSDTKTSIIRWDIIHQLDASLHSCLEKHIDYHIKALTIKGLPKDTNELWTSTDIFRKLLPKIDTLSLYIDTDPESTEQDQKRSLGSLDHNKHNDVWISLFSHWIEPTIDQITSLSLESNENWGWRTGVEFDKFVFPHLRYLLLGGYSFVTGIELDWIIKLAPTLQELYLNRCTIILTAETRNDTDYNASKTADDSLHGEMKSETSKQTQIFAFSWASFYNELVSSFHRLQRFRSGTWDSISGKEGNDQIGDFQTEHVHPRLSLHRYGYWRYDKSLEIIPSSRCSTLTRESQARIKADDDAFDILRNKMENRGQSKGIFRYSPVWRFCYFSCNTCSKYQGPYWAISNDQQRGY